MPIVLMAALLTLLTLSQSTVHQKAGLRQIAPGHYVYLHTDDAPGVSSTFNSGIIVTSEGVVVVDALSSEEIDRSWRTCVPPFRKRSGEGPPKPRCWPTSTSRSTGASRDIRRR